MKTIVFIPFPPFFSLSSLFSLQEIHLFRKQGLLGCVRVKPCYKQQSNQNQNK